MDKNLTLPCEERTFDESLLARDNKQKISAIEFENLKKSLDEQTREREHMAEELKGLRDSLEEMRRQNLGKRHYTAHEKTEKETRQSIINTALKSMRRAFCKDCVEEVPVVGMSTSSGPDSVDYVLYADDNKPLALVVARKTSVDAGAGRQQAYEYTRRFDVMIYQITLSKIEGEKGKYKRLTKIVKRSAAVLQQKATIPEVYAARDTLQKVSDDIFRETTARTSIGPCG